jgi:hypothetical protein
MADMAERIAAPLIDDYQQHVLYIGHRFDPMKAGRTA